MSDKTLGQVAKHAFLNATGPSSDDDWQAAAEAVEAEIRKDIESLLSPEAREVLLVADRYISICEEPIENGYYWEPEDVVWDELRQAVKALRRQYGEQGGE